MALDEAEFVRLFRESGLVEWKQGLSVEKVREAVVAFSNSAGGVIQIGVADDGRVVGQRLDPGFEYKVHQLISSVFNPGRYALSELVVGDRTVVVLSVEKRHEGFAQLPNGQIVVRRGKSNVGLFGQDLVEFIGARALTRFETVPQSVRFADCDAGLVEEIARAFGWRTPDDYVQRFAELGLCEAGPNPRLTVAGALYLLADASPLAGKAHVEIFRFATSDDDFDKRTEIAGPLHHQVELATQAVMSELGTDQVVLGAYRYELPRLPSIVVREAVANAVAHRSYENNLVPIRVSVYRDRVVVRSPGGFPEPVTEHNIRDTQAARNPAIIRVLRRLHLAEDAGLGVDRMQDAMRAEMLETPDFRSLDFAVEVTLPLTGTVHPKERAWVRELERRGEIAPPDRIVLVHAARGEVLTNASVRSLLGVDSVESRQVLQRLRDAAFLRQSGERGGSQYRIERGLLQAPAGLRLTRGELKEVVMSHARAGHAITNASLREVTGLDREEVKQLLRELVEEEQLVLAGQRRGAHYTLPSAPEARELPLTPG